MLQFITQPPHLFSIAEQCQMVIEGGCAWIQLHLPEADERTLRDELAELKPLCQESGTFLMLENNAHLAKEFGLHGVHFTELDDFDPVRVREELGPEAIIGVETSKPSFILELQNSDIDYVTLPSFLDEGKIKEIIAEARNIGCTIPIVVSGNIGIDDVPKLLSLGASGICTGKKILESANPVRYTEELIAVLQPNV